jgi:hypothetical protein
MKKVKTEEITKLMPEELSKLQGMVSEFNNIQLKVGDLEIQKHQALHNLAGVSNALESFQAELKEIYGDVIVDINTGDFKPKGSEVSS